MKRRSVSSRSSARARNKRSRFRTFRPLLERLELRLAMAGAGDPFIGHTSSVAWIYKEDMDGNGDVTNDPLADGFRTSIKDIGQVFYGNRIADQILGNADSIVKENMCGLSPYVRDPFEAPPPVSEHELNGTAGHVDYIEHCDQFSPIPTAYAPNGDLLNDLYDYEFKSGDSDDVWQTPDFSFHPYLWSETTTVFTPPMSERPEADSNCLEQDEEEQQVENGVIVHHYYRDCFSDEETTIVIPVFHLPVVTGKVVVDANADGFVNGESSGLAGVKVFQDLNDNGRYEADRDGGFAITNGSGEYKFLASPAPSWSRIMVEIPANLGRYILPRDQPIHVYRSGQPIEHDIGLVYQVGASGVVFDDLNGDGIRGQEDNPVSGATVYFDHDATESLSGSYWLDGEPLPRYVDATSSGIPGGFELACAGYYHYLEACDETGADGKYVIEGSLDNLVQGGWYGDALRVLPPGLPGEYSVTQVSSHTITGRDDIAADFGVFKNATVSGRVTWDHNADGVSDNLPIPDVWVSLDTHSDGIDRQVQTDANGSYSFTGVPAGSHTIWVFPKDGNKATIPVRGAVPSYVVQPLYGEQITGKHFSFATDAEFERGEIAQEEESESMRQLKDDVLRGILAKINELNDDYPNWSRLRNLVGDLIPQDNDGHVAKSVTLERLQLLSNLVTLQSRIEADGGWWDEAWDGITTDIDRLKNGAARIWDGFWDEVINLEDDALWDERARKFDHLAKAAITHIGDGMGRLWFEMRDNWDTILLDAVVKMGDSAFKLETYQKLATELLALDSLKKAIDPEVPVEERIGHFLLGFTSLVSTLEGGAAIASMTKTRFKALANKLAAEISDDPKVAQQLAARLARHVDGAAPGGPRGALKLLDDGDVIPPGLMNELGYTDDQINAIRRIAAGDPNGNPPLPAYSMRFRTTNPQSTKFIQTGEAVPKPLDVKAKTINEHDVYLGYDPGHQGLVGMKDPKTLVKPDATQPCKSAQVKLCNEIKDRYLKRVNEYDELAGGLDATKFKVDPQGRVIDVIKDKPIAGDIDPVSFQRPDGSFVTGPEYDRLVKELRDSRALVQHGAETNIVDDVKRAMQQTCVEKPVDCIAENSPEWKEVIKKTEKVQLDLRRNHLDDKEVTIEFRPDGTVRRAKVEDLPSIDYDGNVVIAPKPLTEAQIADKAQLKRVLDASGVQIRNQGIKSIDALLTEFRDRRDAQILQVDRRLANSDPNVGIDGNEFGGMSSQQFVKILDNRANGLRVDPPAPAGSGGEGEGDLTAQSILDKIREVVGDAGLSKYRVEPTATGFVVFSTVAMENAMDVSGDGVAAPVDALIIINALNSIGTARLVEWPSMADLLTDKDDDGYRSPIDALIVINYINRKTAAGGEGEAAAQRTATVTAPAPTSVFRFETRATTNVSQAPPIAAASLDDHGTTTPPLRTAIACLVDSNTGWADTVDSIFTTDDSAAEPAEAEDWSDVMVLFL